MSSFKTAKPINWPLEMWIQVGQRNHVQCRPVIGRRPDFPGTEGRAILGAPGPLRSIGNNWREPIIRWYLFMQVLYTFDKRPEALPPNCHFPWGSPGPHLIHGSYWTIRVHTPNNTSIGLLGLANLAQLMPQLCPNRETDTQNIGNNKPHLCTLCMRCGPKPKR